jgi:ribosomal protein L11 methyltransferase
MSSASDGNETKVWHVCARVRGNTAAEAVLGIFDASASAVSAFETSPGEWHIEAYPPACLLSPDFVSRLALAAAAAGGALGETAEEKLGPRDWLAENRLAFPPLRIGRFFIYGSHYRGPVPTNAVGIRLDAATAFGTGEHPSTRGCLLALQYLARRRRYRHLLDIGAGTGILAIAAANLLHCPVAASDIDAGAVAFARRNVTANGVAALVRVGRAAGYRDRALSGRRYDLVFANILARPLALMAADLGRALAHQGHAVLSGLLRRQESIVLAPHRGCGIVLERRLVIDGWSTLILRAARIRQPCAGRALVTGGTQRRSLRDRHAGRLRGSPGSASGGCRYRQASGRRAPSARHRPAPWPAIRKRPSRPW